MSEDEIFCLAQAIGSRAEAIFEQTLNAATFHCLNRERHRTWEEADHTGESLNLLPCFTLHELLRTAANPHYQGVGLKLVRQELAACPGA